MEAEKEELTAQLQTIKAAKRARMFSLFRDRDISVTTSPLSAKTGRLKLGQNFSAMQTCWIRPATVAGESLGDAEARAATHRAAEM